MPIQGIPTWELYEEGIAPLGATWNEVDRSYKFVIYSKNAGAVVLLLYGKEDFTKPLRKFVLHFPRNKTGRYWHIHVKAEDAAGALYYAYQIYPSDDHGLDKYFDSEKILLDPYARGVFFPPAHDRQAACQPGSNAGKAPLGILPPQKSQPAVINPIKPRHGHDLIIYEMHVRGFTRHESSNLEPAHRGTFAGIVDKIPYLQELGITAIELMPVFQFDPNEGNYWGYMPLSFFAPHIQYSVQAEVESALQEFRSMVDALHAADIEIFLDVVYNHTTEAGQDGPTYSYRGIDNSTYYVLKPPNFEHYVNFSACGNDMKTSHAVVRRLVMDSLRLWTNEMGVDGFRFDLASILARTGTGDLDPEDPPLISEMNSDPTLAGTRLIAEPWQGASGGGYMMGHLFPVRTWYQWNDHFREEVRAFVKGDPGLVPALMTRLYGSTDLFPDDLLHAYRPAQNINYIDSHDGLCLYDLVTYTNNDQRSWNCGHEGDIDTPPDVLALRKRQVKNFCCLLMLANGTPMFCAGDEFLRTQGGNSNPWDQDNPINWLDWTLHDKNSDIFLFFKHMIEFRKNHPALSRNVGWKDHVRWYGVTPLVDLTPDSRSLAFFLEGADIDDNNFYVMVNAFWQPLSFKIHEPGGWKRVIDTALSIDQNILPTNQAVSLYSETYMVQALSIVVLINSSDSR